MPTSVGPNTFGEENLVFGYDTGDTANSYKGEPTTNNIVDQRYSFEANRAANHTTASWSESEQAWYFTLPSGSQDYYRGLRVVNNISSPYAVFEPTGSEVAFSYKIQALSDGVWNFIDYNNRAATGSQSYGNDNRSFTDGPSSLALEKGKIYERKGHYITQANDPLLTGSLYHCYNVICFGPPNANNTNVDNGGAISEAKTIKIWDIQHELKDHATQFTTGTRTNTDSLKDLTGNSTIDLTNVSFDSDAQMTFDGTDDYILTGIDTPTNPLTVSIWFNQHSVQGRAHLLGNFQSGILKGANFSTESRRILWYMYGPGVYGFGNTGISGTDYNLNEWNNVVYWNNGLEYRIYLNGELKASKEDSGWAQVPDLSIGGNHDYFNDFFDGKIDSVKIYSRALTATEIKANYNAIKGRFNI